MATLEAQVAHIWRRLGFGPRRTDVTAGMASGTAALVASLGARPLVSFAASAFPAPSASQDAHARRELELMAFGPVASGTTKTSSAYNPLQERMSWTLRGLVVVGIADSVYVPDMSDHVMRMRDALGSTYRQLLRTIITRPGMVKELTGLVATPSVLAALAPSWGGDGNLKDLVLAIAMRPEFLSDQAIFNRTKSPVERVVAAARLLQWPGLGSDANLAWMLSRMAQIPWSPPNVSGRPKGDQWLNAGNLFAWSSLANMMAMRGFNWAGAVAGTINPTVTEVHTTTSAATATGYVFKAAGLTPVSARTTNALRDYATTGSWTLARASHGALPWLANRWHTNSDVAIVQGTGENVVRDMSHFAAMAYRWAGAFGGALMNTGWLGRYNDLAHPGQALGAVSLSGTHQSLSSVRSPSVAIDSLDTFSLSASNVPDRARFLTDLGAFGSPASIALNKVGTASRAIAQAGAASTTVSGVPRLPQGGSSGSLAAQMSTAATLILGGIPCQTYVATLGGFDTHGSEPYNQWERLNLLNAGLAHFFSLIDGTPRAADVFVVIQSEFGRQITQNAGQGTDHGLATSTLIIGGGVHGGLYGQFPSLAPAARADGITARMPRAGADLQAYLEQPLAAVSPTR